MFGYFLWYFKYFATLRFIIMIWWSFCCLNYYLKAFIHTYSSIFMIWKYERKIKLHLVWGLDLGTNVIQHNKCESVVYSVREDVTSNMMVVKCLFLQVKTLVFFIANDYKVWKNAIYLYSAHTAHTLYIMCLASFRMI